jgi:hypothetical protein
MLSLIIAWLGWDYSSEAETADKETLLIMTAIWVAAILKKSP